MHKVYSPQSFETSWIEKWNQPSTFQFAVSDKQSGYCIMLPPPNVTGSLHMGHGFQVSLMDALVRYQRMMGKQVFWQGGTDHAGIATQLLVEQQLSAQGHTRNQLGRERFLEAVWQWKAQSGHQISQQLRRMGASIETARDRFTCDPGFTTAVIDVFVQLYEAGLLYRGKRLVNWDPHLLTAVSDLEVIHHEEAGSLYYLKYPLAHQEGHIIVATTRPETLFGDVAVAVHPEDSRYQKWIGQSLMLPLMNRTIPIIADDSVDPSFGSGCVKITPAHDFNDYALGKRHNLELITILTPSAKLNEHVPNMYQGLDCLTARERLVEELDQLGLLEKTETHVLKVPRGDRSGTIIEPYLTNQWFMRMQPLAQPALAAIKSGEIQFVPENWTHVCLQWLENIEDWCISRQLWWGHRIPAWYGPQGELFVGEDEISVRKKYALTPEFPLKQDEDVLDTWVSSALWPFVTLGWPESTSELEMFYPTDVLVTGFDIIFFWVARMIMLSLYFTNKVPFKLVYITGLIRDALGQKMSKSKGNVLDPIDIIEGISKASLVQKRTQNLLQPKLKQTVEKLTQQQFPKGIEAFGTDALRLTYYALAAPTRDIRFDLNRTTGYRNFCNKLWQATRFVLSHSEGTRSFKPSDRSIFDQWILSRLDETIRQVHLHFEQYRFDWIVQTLYEFVWHDFCDWYLEFAKLTLMRPDLQGMFSSECARGTLMTVLEKIIRLLHPFAPFITEELWQYVQPLLEDKTSVDPLCKVRYPQDSMSFYNPEAIEAVQWLQSIIKALRSLRSELGISPAKQIVLRCCGSAHEATYLKGYQPYLMTLAKVSTLTFEETHPPETEPCAVTQVGELTFWMPLSSVIDIADETQRLLKEKQRLQKSIEQSCTRLSEIDFIQRAPKLIVEKVRQQKMVDESQLDTVLHQLNKLQNWTEV